MNKAKLESIMKLNGHTGQDVADFLGIARTTFSSKLNETRGAEFTQGEISILKYRYDLSPTDVDAIFFAKEVS